MVQGAECESLSIVVQENKDDDTELFCMRLYKDGSKIGRMNLAVKDDVVMINDLLIYRNERYKHYGPWFINKMCELMKLCGMKKAQLRMHMVNYHAICVFRKLGFDFVDDVDMLPEVMPEDDLPYSEQWNAWWMQMMEKTL